MGQNFPGYRSITLMFALLILLVTSGCGSKTTVVLLPDLDGKVGAVHVSNSAGSVDMKTANQATTVSGLHSPPGTPVVLKKQEIDAVFSKALRAQPKPPVHFLLYFKNDSNELRRDSLNSLETIIQTIKERNSIDLNIVGHTDTIGSAAYNYNLSKDRAEAVARLFVTRGVQQDHIHITSHGEVNLFIQTGDNVSEPRNRRVEVVVR